LLALDAIYSHLEEDEVKRVILIAGITFVLSGVLNAQEATFLPDNAKHSGQILTVDLSKTMNFKGGIPVSVMRFHLTSDPTKHFEAACRVDLYECKEPVERGTCPFWVVPYGDSHDLSKMGIVWFVKIEATIASDCPVYPRGHTVFDRGKGTMKIGSTFYAIVPFGTFLDEAGRPRHE
jgi:hypothetical protein